MKEAKNMSATLYTSGAYTILAKWYKEKDGSRCVDFYLQKDGDGDFLFAYGWCLDQPDNRDGHTYWTEEEALAMFEDGLRQEKMWYDKKRRFFSNAIAEAVAKGEF